jgi:hypothetical protein
VRAEEASLARLARRREAQAAAEARRAAATAGLTSELRANQAEAIRRERGGAGKRAVPVSAVGRQAIPLKPGCVKFAASGSNDMGAASRVSSLNQQDHGSPQRDVIMARQDIDDAIGCGDREQVVAAVRRAMALRDDTLDGPLSLLRQYWGTLLAAEAAPAKPLPVRSVQADAAGNSAKESASEAKQQVKFTGLTQSLGQL